ncbi:MAG: transcription antitermination factor NusB [Phycisphaerales bacterium]|nr:transcription antitermination factor NusB [Phycisphaerales bacterium]
MARPRDIRTLAFTALFQLDAAEGDNLDTVRAWVEHFEADEHGVKFEPRDRRKAMATAEGAWASRREADTAFRELSPEWPAHRMPAADRAVLRLAHYEMTQTTNEPKAIVNEAIELAKTFGTERSPGFVNALLDAILKQVLAQREGAA